MQSIFTKILMSVLRVLTTVCNDVLILLVHMHVSATLAIGSPQMSVPAMVIVVMSVSKFYVVLFVIDIDECAEGISGCSHRCSNTVGSYYCSCPIGYRLTSDNLTCNGEQD